MHDMSTQQVLAGKVAHPERSKDRVHCRYCGSDKVFRLYREGFLQERVFPLLGFYPWRCKICSANMLLHKRRFKKATRHAG